MRIRTLLGSFLLAVVTFCMSACEDDAELILFSGSDLIDQSGTCGNAISSSVLYLNGRPTEDIGIANGKGGYSARSSDETVVTATISNNRLLINSHGKKGKAVITIKDKKDNRVSLPVTVSYGILTLYCQSERFSVAKDNKYIEDDALQAQVNAEMTFHSFMKEDEKCILKSVAIDNFLIEGSSGSFIIRTPDGKNSAEGTYTIKRDDSLTGKKNIAFVFSYNNKNQTFFYNPRMDSSRATRDTGPLPCFLVEDVTSLCPQSISLPEGAKVFYGVYSSNHGIRPEE